jgi:DNA-binding SARP family transcriptional activator
MEISIFGSMTVRDGGRWLGPGDFGGRKPKQLLEALVLARGRVVSKDALVEALWPVAAPRNPSATIDTYVCVLRQRLFADRSTARRVLATLPGSYRFDPAGYDLDLDRFDQLTRQAEATPDRLERRRHLEDALALADAGEVLEDEPYVSWVEEERVLYRERVGRARLAAAREALVAGEPAAALRHAEATLRRSPYSEGAFRIVMLADHVLGCTDLALGAFQRCREILGQHLGVDPTSETADLAAAIDAGTAAAELVAVALGGPAPRPAPSAPAWIPGRMPDRRARQPGASSVPAATG